MTNTFQRPLAQPRASAVTDSWLQPHLLNVLRNNLAVLESWRQQSNQNGRMKNFENWVLVELHDQLPRQHYRLGVNGFFDLDAAGVPRLNAKKKMKAAEVPNICGRKARVTHLSPDLSAWLPGSRDCLMAELKTGVATRDSSQTWHVFAIFSSVA